MKDKIQGFLNGIISAVGEQLAALIISKYVTKDNIIDAVDAGLDVLEDLAKKTDTTLDDKVLKQVRDALNIPDED
jgi:hypothetical protein